jgi:fibronectin type 3 domain-containing protein
MKKLTLTLLSALLVVLFSGCSENISTPQYTKPKINPNLEMIEKKSIKYISDINSIAFEWKRAKSDDVEGYVVYRIDTSSSAKQLAQVAKIKSRYTSHYLDQNLRPKTEYIYRFATYSKDDRESNATKNLNITTKDRPVAVSYIESINNLPKTAKIIWRPHVSERIKGYTIYKNDASSTKFEKLDFINGRLNAEYIDTKLEDSKVYRYKVVAVTYDNVDSYPSKVVACNTKPLPKMIELISATKGKPKEIHIKWTATDISDKKEYRVYRATSVDGSYSLIKKTKDTELKEIVNKNGQKYFYKVTVVDKDGLESLKQEVPIMGSTLASPQAPILSSVTENGGVVVIKWLPKDNRATSYIVVKRIKSAWRTIKKINIKDIKGKEFIDKNIKSGENYEYSIKSVDKYNLVSKESARAEVKIPPKGKK